MKNSYSIRKYVNGLPEYSDVTDNLVNMLYKLGTEDYRKLIIRTNGNDLRKLYKGFAYHFVEKGLKNQKPKSKKKLNTWQKKQIKIYNSSFNRKPNLQKKDVRIKKLKYVLKLGTGLASINVVPTSKFIDKNQEANVFYIKDRGHILEILCVEYESDVWVVSEAKQMIKNLIAEIPENKLYPNEDNIRARRILENVESYLEDLDNSFDKAVSKIDRRFSLNVLCQKVPEFNHYINEEPFALEGTKETVETHCKEIEALNNILNAWIEFQLSMMRLSTYDRQKNGYEKYLNETLKLHEFIDDCEEQDVWLGSSNSKCLSTPIGSYDKRVAESTHIIPLFLSTHMSKDFTQTKSDWYLRSGDQSVKMWTELLKGMIDNNVDYKTIVWYTKLFEYIIDYATPWNTFNEKVKKLAKEFKDNNPTMKDAYLNLYNCNVLSESFGSACVVAIAQISLNQKGSVGKYHEPQVRRITKNFLDEMYNRLEEFTNDLSNINKEFYQQNGMETRFSEVILPTYTQVLNSGSTETKPQIVGNHWSEMYDRYWIGSSNPNLRYSIIPLTLESWSSKTPTIKYIDFNLVESNPEESKIELGRKHAGLKYTTENTLLQSKYFNKSILKLDQEVSSAVHWTWWAEWNYKLAEKFNSNDDYIEVWVDAKKLLKKFSRDLLNEDELDELQEYSEFMANFNDVYKF